MIEFIPGGFADLRAEWDRIYRSSSERLLFSSPGWSEVWWRYFGQDGELKMGAVSENGSVIGICPLRIKDGSLVFAGSDNVCDFLDFPVVAGKEQEFCRALLDHFLGSGATSLDLGNVLPDALVKRFLVPAALERGLTATCTSDDITVSMDLPHDLPAYLASLSSKQRHEILRKERRLNEEGDVAYHIEYASNEKDVDTFLQFFRESREDKNRFLTDTMEAFFRAIIDMAAAEKMLELGILELNGIKVAVTLSFIYQNDVYLYNSGYNPDYRAISIGVLSKYYYIGKSIENGRRRFDFLKGPEKYKFHLGGNETQLYRCIINR